MAAKKTPSLFDSFKGFGQKKGTKDKEIEKYEKMLEEHPDDRNALNTLGDLYAKRNNPEKACEYYLKVGELYAKDGFTLKAIAVYKKAQRAKPEVIQTYIDLADLYVQKGLIGEAKSNYLQAAEMQASAGAKHESLDIYRKIADLDPSNIHIRSKLAVMYEKEDFLEDAAIIYAEIGDASIQKEPAEGKQYYQRAMELQPENEEILSRIGYAYVDQDMRQEAINIFQTLHNLNPRNLDYQEQLEELQAPPIPQAAASAGAPIMFSEDELNSLNLGEDVSQELSSITMVEDDSDSHVIDFPLTDVSSELSAPVASAEPMGLDFQIEDQASSSGAYAPPEQAEIIVVSDDQPIDFYLEEPTAQSQPHIEVQATPPSSGTAGFFDLASRLETAVQIGREFDTGKTSAAVPNLKVKAPESLATSEISDIIKEFKQGVLEEVGSEDFETHYELGISYKEMSLLDDAIEELKLAALEPGKFVECQGVIGLCYIEKGDYANAIKAFQSARAKVAKTSEEYQDLTYQIAVSYEESGKEMESARELQVLYQIKPDYRDVKNRLKRLMG